jgi:RNA polymerase sigma-70 factor (ECF subfamily)
MKLFKNNINTETEQNASVEKQLIEEVKSGNANAFRKLMDKHQLYVSKIVYKVLWDNEDTADAIQDTFIKVWKNIKTFRDDVKFSTWLYKIALNTAYDKLRARKARTQLFSTSESKIDELISQNISKDFCDHISDKNLVEIIKYLSQELSNVQKLVFTLIDLEKLTINEAAGILNMPGNNVKANLSYARKSIRLKLVNYLKRDQLK